MRRIPPQVDRLVHGIDFHAPAVPRFDRLGQKRVAVAHCGRHDAHAVGPDVGGEIAEVQIPVELRIGVGPDRLFPDAPVVEPVNAPDAKLAEPLDQQIDHFGGKRLVDHVVDEIDNGSQKWLWAGCLRNTRRPGAAGFDAHIRDGHAGECIDCNLAKRPGNRAADTKAFTAIDGDDDGLRIAVDIYPVRRVGAELAPRLIVILMCFHGIERIDEDGFHGVVGAPLDTPFVKRDRCRLGPLQGHVELQFDGVAAAVRKRKVDAAQVGQHVGFALRAADHHRCRRVRARRQNVFQPSILDGPVAEGDFPLATEVLRGEGRKAVCLGIAHDESCIGGRGFEASPSILSRQEQTSRKQLNADWRQPGG